MSMPPPRYDGPRLRLPKRRFRRIPVRTLVPNVITLLALCAGLTAIRMAFENRYVLALAAIVFAAFLDGIDGRLARFLKGTSRFGAELDSLADFVNFGVAPALILYFWGLHDLKSAGWIAAMVFAICAALRLARFNVMVDDPDKPAWASNFFVGMPAPAGAITVLLPIYVALLGLPRSEWLSWLTLVYTLAIASLMVSRLPVFSGKRVGTRVPPEMVGPAVVVAVLFIALLIAYPWIILTAGTLAYLGALPFGYLSYRGYERRTRESRGEAALAHGAGVRRRCGQHRPGRRQRRSPVAPQLSRYRRCLTRSSRETKHACCAPHLPGLDHGVGGGSGRHAHRLRRRAAIFAQAASRVLRGVERARQVFGAMGAPGRGAIGRPHPHRSVSLDAARRRAGRSVRPGARRRRGFGLGRSPAIRRGGSRRSRRSSCRFCRRAGRW